MNLIDKILVKMPGDLEYFIPAAAVLQDYCVQLHRQTANRQRAMPFEFTVVVENDGLMFFQPLFPRMNVVVAEDIRESRAEWSCVLDFANIARAWSLAEIPRKHITEAWGILFGAGPRPVPELGPLMPDVVEKPVDVLFDERVVIKDVLGECVAGNHAELSYESRRLTERRPATLFSILSQAKVLVAVKGEATYLAAAMKIPTIELCDGSSPKWWMSKPQDDRFRSFYGAGLEAMVWPFLDEMICAANGYEKDDDLIAALQPFSPAMEEA